MQRRRHADNAGSQYDDVEIHRPACPLQPSGRREAGASTPRKNHASSRASTRLESADSKSGTAYFAMMSLLKYFCDSALSVPSFFSKSSAAMTFVFSA